MKKQMKKIFLTALTAAVLISCSKQDEAISDNSNNAGQTSLSVKLDLSKFSTKSGDNSISALPEWETLLLVAKKDGEIREKTVSKSEFAAFPGGIVPIFDREAVNFTGGTVEVYILTKGHGWGTITALNTPNLPTLAAGQTDINNWQPSAQIAPGIAGKFVNVPYYGSGSITDNGPGGSSGNHQLVAAVTVIPELARIQVIDSPQSGKVSDNGNKVTSIEVTGIYINNVTSGGVVKDIRVGGVPASSWYADYYEAGKSLAGMTDILTDKGYQIFKGDKPHVIVKINYQLNDDTQVTYVGYLTIQKFTYDDGITNATGGDLTVAKGKVYNIDLSGLMPTYDQIGDVPYDNTVYYDLKVTVTVQPWYAVVASPEL